MLASLPLPLATRPLGQRVHLPLDKVSLRRLKTESEIATVLPLREGIDLSAHLAAGADFHSLEKKETNSASWSRSTLKVSASAPSASFHWASA